MALSDSRESVRMALDTLRANKLRSGLTILGIVIGIATVITISSLINGVNNRVADLASQFGTNVLWVFRWNFIGIRPTAEMLARKQFTLDDAQAITTLPHVVAVNAARRFANWQLGVGYVAIQYKDKKVQNSILIGTLPAFSIVDDVQIQEGRPFTEDEEFRRADVTVLGHDTAEKLFGTEDPLGKDVVIGGDVFTVIGVLDKYKQLFGGGSNPEDNKAVFPMSTFHKIHPEILDTIIAIKYDDAKNKAMVTEEVRTMMRERRRVRVEKDDDFAIFGPDNILTLWGQITAGLVIFMFAVSSVGLLVGGVGVMNIMLMSVTQRTREIGVRKAIGARRRDVISQFLIEAIVLTGSGGVIGVLLGVGISLLINLAVPKLPSYVPLWAIVMAVGVSMSVGLFFGMYPAVKAARLDPVEALRYE